MRKSGVLMPIFSLPSEYGIGNFGKEAFSFVNFLRAAGQSIWQILPLNPTNYGDSPYQSFSCFAGNPYFIDPETLISEGLITEREAKSFDFGDSADLIDYGLLYQNRTKLLKTAYSRFEKGEGYHTFCNENAFWLDDYALFMAIKSERQDTAWHTWPEPIRRREQAALENEAKRLSEEIDFYRFLQYKFYEQWFALKNYANQNGIEIVGDIPIYMAHDSADVWADPKQFLLDSDLTPTLVAGCPPDAFSEDGQLWGNPIYDWSYMKKDGFAFWRRRMGFAFKIYDVVRIDHFRGLESFYAIPFGDSDATGGKWNKGPGMSLFRALSADFGGRLPIIAEDLGFLTPEVKKLLKNSGFPGMKVLQFAFDSREESDYLPHNYPHECVVYTGTHDNDTIIGWSETAPKEDVAFARRYLGVEEGESLCWPMMRAAMMSVADTCVLMMADLVGLDSNGRINTPSTLGNNWNCRIRKECINDWLAGVLYENTALYGRLPK